MFIKDLSIMRGRHGSDLRAALRSKTDNTGSKGCTGRPLISFCMKNIVICIEILIWTYLFWPNN